MLHSLPLALALLAPIASDPGMGLEDARHLLARTGFGGDLATIQDFAGWSRADAVQRLLDDVREEAATGLPEWGTAPLRAVPRGLSPEERRELQRLRNQRALELKAWWYQEMITTDSPLTERLTLLWHNHFTSSLRKVRSAKLMLRQNQLLRRHAAGSFRQLLHAVSADAAMILYLDNQSNNKRRPNENYAREVMELFTLGEGHYSEKDIKEAARAFTGWKVRPEGGAFFVNERQHDFGEKKFMGKTGWFGGHAILDIILEQPRVAIHITERLWREFISETPDRAEVARLAKLFREEDYELKPLLTALFRSPAFWAPENRARLVKSPVELTVGAVRIFGIDADPKGLVSTGRGLGQDILDPPNVKGWPGGTSWITANTLLVREGVLSRMTRPRAAKKPDMKRDMQPGMARDRSARGEEGKRGQELRSWSTALASTQVARRRNAILVLLPGDPVNPLPEKADGLGLVRRLILDPAFQLK